MAPAKKWLALLLALLMTVSCLAACASDKTSEGGTTDPAPSASGDAAPADGAQAGSDRTVTIGVLTANDTHDLVANSEVPRYQRQMIYEHLMNINPETREVEYQLAESVEYTDETTLRITLRDDVKFTDGQTLTSRDVFYSLRDVWAVGNQAMYFSCYDWDNSKIVDDRTIELKFTQPFGPAVTYLAQYDIFCYDDLFGESPADADKWYSSPNGTSPYYCVENVASSYVTYARKDAADYYGELPACEKVTYRYYSESTTMYIDFETGVLDVACALNSQDAARVLDGDCPEHTAHSVNSLNDVLMLILPEYSELFADESVRKAFAMSVDAESVAVAMYGALFAPADSILASTMPFYKSEPVAAYDPEGAKALLAEAGYPDGVDLRFIVAQDNRVLAEALQGSLEGGGFRVSVESYDVPTCIGMWQNSETDFLCKETAGGGYLNDPAQVLNTLSPTSTLTPAKMENETWVEQFNAALYNTDPDTRRTAYEALQDYAVETYRCIPVCERVNMTVWNSEKIAAFPMAIADAPNARYIQFA